MFWSTEKINFQKIWVQIWCICPTYVCVSVDILIGLEVRMNRSTVKIVSFFCLFPRQCSKASQGFLSVMLSVRRQVNRVLTSPSSCKTSPCFVWREKSLLPKFLGQLDPWRWKRGKGKKEEQEWKWRNRRNKNIPPLPLPAIRRADLALM